MLNKSAISPRQVIARVFILLVLLTTMIAIYNFLIHPVLQHKSWSKRMSKNIIVLAHNRPPNLARGEWEYLIGWTHQLHSNCAAYYTSLDQRLADQFLSDLEEKLQNEISLLIIDWIWDQYALFTKTGFDYSEKYRPTTNRRYQNAEVGCFGQRYP